MPPRSRHHPHRAQHGQSQSQPQQSRSHSHSEEQIIIPKVDEELIMAIKYEIHNELRQVLHEFRCSLLNEVHESVRRMLYESNDGGAYEEKGQS